MSVSFDGLKALNNLSLDISEGELRCILLGQMAGKTTMMDVITGKTSTRLRHSIFGQHIDLLTLNEQEIANAGIAENFKKPTVFEALYGI